MTTPLDKEKRQRLRDQLAELRELEEKATPGDWEWWRNPDNLDEDGVHAHSLAKRDESGNIVDATTICRGMTGPNRENNAQFIAAARNALPWLLNIVDSLWVERDDARAERDRAINALDRVAGTLADAATINVPSHPELWRGVEDLVAERDRLKAALETAEKIGVQLTTALYDAEEKHLQAGGDMSTALRAGFAAGWGVKRS